MVSWVLLKESLITWRESQQQIMTSPKQFSFNGMRHSLVRVFSTSLAPTSSLYRTLLPPLLFRPSPPPPRYLPLPPILIDKSPFEPTEPITSPTLTHNWVHKQVIERQNDLQQMLPVLPLMLMLLREKKRTNGDHLELIGADETDKIPVVLPFWYKVFVVTRYQ
jgi:hypothetical protein